MVEAEKVRNASSMASVDGRGATASSALSVTEFSCQLKRHIEGSFQGVWVLGEISGLKVHSSGHVYFSLKDEKSVLDVVCWRSYAAAFAPFPEEGARVRCRGQITIYGGRSKYQMILGALEREGEGDLLRLLEERKKRLFQEGLFQRKRPLPFFPRAVGLVTALTGAAVQDMLHRLKERFPCQVYVWPVPVQGVDSPKAIQEAIKGFNQWRREGEPPAFQFEPVFGHQAASEKVCPQVLIIARGGGSIEDLWGFNDETLAREAFRSDIPVVSGVGHETDTTLLDYVVDLRAPTPTAAIEMALPHKGELELALRDKASRLLKSIGRLCQERNQVMGYRIHNFLRTVSYFQEKGQDLDRWSERFQRAWERLIFQVKHKVALISQRLERAPKWAMEVKKNRFQEKARSLSQGIKRALEIRREKLNHSCRILQALSYRNALKRGFVMVSDEHKKLIPRASELARAKVLSLHFYDEVVALKNAPA